MTPCFFTAIKSADRCKPIRSSDVSDRCLSSDDLRTVRDFA